MRECLKIEYQLCTDE